LRVGNWRPGHCADRNVCRFENLNSKVRRRLRQFCSAAIKRPSPFLGHDPCTVRAMVCAPVVTPAPPVVK
jgi:hypothetical protein